MTVAFGAYEPKLWLPAEPGIANPELSQRLTRAFLQPWETELELFFLEMREHVDVDLSAQYPQKFGQPYPIGRCLEISKAVLVLVRTVDPDQLSGSVLQGYRALHGFLEAGGEMRRVWGDLRGTYFQNALQIGTFYVDVANDTVIPTKPKVEILPFEQSGLKAIEDYSHFANVAQRYWHVNVWPNHVVPGIAPLFPLIVETKDARYELRDYGGYMMSMNLKKRFAPAEHFLNSYMLTEDIRNQVSRDLEPLVSMFPASTSIGQQKALKAIEVYRSKSIHCDIKSQKRLTEIGLAANRTLYSAAVSRKTHSAKAS